MYKFINWITNYNSVITTNNNNKDSICDDDKYSISNIDEDSISNDDKYYIINKNNTTINNDKYSISNNDKYSISDDDEYITIDDVIITCSLNRITNVNNYLVKIYNEKNKPTSKEIKDKLLDNYYKETDLFYDITICKKILEGKNCKIILYFYYDIGKYVEWLHNICNESKNKKEIKSNIEIFCKAINLLENEFKNSIEKTEEVIIIKEIIKTRNFEQRKKRKK
jgi:hypothetical protein